MRTTVNLRPVIMVLLTLLGSTTGIFAQASSVESSAQSVVSINARSAGGTSQGSGFIWQKPIYVVTALHVVAGAQQIEVYSEHKKAASDAVVIAANHEADLALLKLKEDLALPPLQEAGVSPNSREEFYIWGYPQDVAKLQGDFIRFSLSLDKTPTLKSIFKSANQLKKTIGDQGYPAITARILRISTTIQPGHSGAPIVDQSGRVVGIGDGGLRQGIARINWAIPAAVYLPTLPAAKDPIPGKSSVQAGLFGHHVANAVSVATGGKSVLEKVWTVSLQEVITTADSNLVDIFDDLNQKSIEESGKSLGAAMIDVYEDSETGATIAVPKDFPVQYDRASRLLRTSYGGAGRLEMIIQIVVNDSWTGGMNALSGYERKLFGNGGWVEDPEIADAEFFDEEDSTLFISRFRYRPDAQDEAIDEINVTLVIDQNDFLGAAVVAGNLPAFDSDAWYEFYVMHMCAELADFSIE